jgi:hypothetical protein
VIAAAGGEIPDRCGVEHDLALEALADLHRGLGR